MMSLEKSLSLLAPTGNSTVEKKPVKRKPVSKKRLVSPVKIPSMSEDEDLDLEGLLRKDSDEEESEEEKKDSEDDEEESEEEKKDSEDDEEESEDSEDESEKEEEKEEPVIKLKKTVNKNLTPTRFKLEVPKSPKNNFFEAPKTKKLTDIKNKLISLRYTIMKFIFNEENSFIDYIVCYDPNGELVFIHLKGAKLKLFDEDKVIKINYSDDSDMDSSFLESIRNKVTPEVYGIIFYNGRDYCTLLRDSSEELVLDYYTTSEDSNRKIYSIPNAYTVLNYDDIVEDPMECIKTTKITYSIIQNEQVNNSKSTIKNMMETAKNFTSCLHMFDKTYKKVTQNIIDDWTTLSEYSSDYYYKYSKEKLTDSDKKSFDQVSINMFIRFQIFNDQIEQVDKLSKTIDKINEAIEIINDTTEQLIQKDEKLTNKVVEIEEVESYI